jgi:hypothetical protein
MTTFFAAGGFVMFPVTLLGGAALALALRHLFAPSGASAAASSSARTALALLAVGGSALDLWAVGSAVASGAFDGEDLVAIALVGGGEAMTPAAFGLALAALAALITTLGDTRRAPAAVA